MNSNENFEEMCYESFAETCKRYGLDPNNTSIHDVECAKLGIPVGKSSPYDVVKKNVEELSLFIKL